MSVGQAVCFERASTAETVGAARANSTTLKDCINIVVQKLVERGGLRAPRQTVCCGFSIGKNLLRENAVHEVSVC